MKVNQEQLNDLNDFLSQVSPAIDKITNYILDNEVNDADTLRVTLKILEKGHNSARSIIQGREKKIFRFELNENIGNEKILFHDRHWFDVALAKITLKFFLKNDYLSGVECVEDIAQLGVEAGGNSKIVGKILYGYTKQLCFNNKQHQAVGNISIKKVRADSSKIQQDLNEGNAIFKPKALI